MLSDYDSKLLGNIDRHGWQFTFVFDPDGKNPDFGYSIGFTQTLNAPEFIVFGLDKGLMNSMIWEVFRQIEGGLQPADGMRLQGLLDGFDCILRKAKHHQLFEEYAVSANWFWHHLGETGHPTVYQIVWPGAQQGLFPWESDCDAFVIESQPQLWISS